MSIHRTSDEAPFGRSLVSGAGGAAALIAVAAAGAYWGWDHRAQAESRVESLPHVTTAAAFASSPAQSLSVGAVEALARPDAEPDRARALAAKDAGKSLTARITSGCGAAPEFEVVLRRLDTALALSQPARGSTTFAELESGAYTLTARRVGWRAAETLIVLRADDLAQTREIEVAVAPNYSIRGQMVDAATNEPIARATLIPESRRMYGALPSYFQLGEVSAESEDGSFCVAGEWASADEVRVTVRADGYDEWISPWADGAPGEIAFAPIRLVRKSLSHGLVRGVVIDAVTRHPVEDAHVLLREGERGGELPVRTSLDARGRVIRMRIDETSTRSEDPACVTTDAQGRFELEARAGPALSIAIRHGDYLPWHSAPFTLSAGGADPPPIEAFLEAGGRIEARIHTPIDPAARRELAFVKLVRPSGEDWIHPSEPDELGVSDLAVAGLEAGVHVLEVATVEIAEDGRTLPPLSALRRCIGVRAGETARVELYCGMGVTGATLFGRIPEQDGELLAVCHAGALAAGTPGPTQFNTWGRRDGTFQITDLDPGTWRVLAIGRNRTQSIVHVWFAEAQAGIEASRTEVQLASEPSRVEFRLAQADARRSGVAIQVEMAAGEAQYIELLKGGLMLRTDPSGSALVLGLPAGRYGARSDGGAAIRTFELAGNTPGADSAPILVEL